MSPNDEDLLRRYAEENSQAAFATLVERHLSLVYSVARRVVRSPQLAEEVAQSVFVDLARHAARMNPSTPLVAWLHLVSRRTAVDVVRRESRRQTRETEAATLAAMNPTPSAWAEVEPLLDEAVESLNESDRSAILLRYFENKSLREIGEVLGASEDAAQKRVSRAVEQLRTFFLQRGVAATATGLATDISAHAVQTAPAGLGAAISATAALPHAAVAAASQLAMTTLQKTVLTAGLALALGGALFEAGVLRAQRADLAALRLRNDDLAAQVRQARQQQDIAARRLDETQQQLAALRASPAPQPAADRAIESAMKILLARLDRIKRIAAQRPEWTIPEFALLTEQDWFGQVQRAGSDSDADMQGVLNGLRNQSKVRFSTSLAEALRAYVKAHDGQLPSDPRELMPYFKENPRFAHPPDEAMLQRYAFLYSGPVSDVPAEERNRVLVEITSPDEERDQRIQVGPGSTGLRNFRDLSADTQYALRAFARANAGAVPVSASQLLPYFNPPLSQARQNRFLQNPGTLLPP